MVATHLLGPAESADLTVYGEVHNASSRRVEGRATISLLGIHAEQPVSLDAGETRTVVFTAEQFPQLRVEHAPLWWPYQMGDPHLETLRMRFHTGGKVSDEATVKVGIREIT